MKSGKYTSPQMIIEIISALAAFVYLGLQIYYGIVYSVGAMRIIMNVLILLLVYAGLTMLFLYPERVNGLNPSVCTGKIRRYTMRMVQLIKFIFVLSLLFTSICDALGYSIDAGYSVIAMGAIALTAIVYEAKIIREVKKPNRKE